jgi:parvulin-like peptidyl-prolyl isomerase
MKMTEDNDRYKKIIEILRSSRPDLAEWEKNEYEVMKRIQQENLRTSRVSSFIESLFGWVYIGWVRRSLIGAAVVLVGIFIYQQAFILKQVNNISKQVISIGNESASVSSSEFDKQLTLYQISSRLSPERGIKISINQLKELLDSYKTLQTKYKDLIRIIEENPDLKQYIETKLIEEKNKKPDI